MKLALVAPRPKQVFLGLALAVVVFGTLVGVTYARTTIPTPSAIASQQITTIYYSNGQVMARIGATNRTDVALSQIPLAVQHAVLAAEDRHFYSEPGVSPTGIVRALAVDVRGGDITQGGSTITQQYAKNAYLSSQRSLTRKLKEIFIATKLGQTRSKATILSDYLNTIYFGRGAYGIQAASEAYFRHGVDRDTVAQGALLAAVIRGPSLYDPRLGASAKALAVARWHYVLDGMVTEGWLPAAKATSLSFPATKKISTKVASQCSGETCFLRDDVEHELITRDGISQAQLELGGYKIVTTINQTDEQALVSAEQNTLPKNDRGTPESGAASIKPGDGAIQALYGGDRYCHAPKKNKNACIDLSGYTGQWARPGGSSFKAFTLIAALKQGISLNSTFNGPYTVDVDGDQIHNASPGETCYGCSLIRAFAQSVNTIFVPLAKQVGPENVIKAAYAAGIPTSRDLSDVPDIALGPDNVSPVDLASAYATVAAQGIAATPYLVQSVTTTTGQHIYQAHKQTKRVFPAALTSDVTLAMEKVLQPGGTAYGHALTGRPSAGKTGTTTANTNAWFTGFTPQLCTSVWIGNVDGNKTLSVGGVGEVFGGTLPAEIWNSMMTASLAGTKVVDFPPAATLGTPEASGSPSPTTSSSPSATATATVTRTSSPPPTSSPSITPTTSPSITPTGGPTTTPTQSPTGAVSPVVSPHRRRR